MISYCDDDDDDDIKINKVSNLVIVSIVSSPIQLFSWFSCIFSIFRYVLNNIWKMIIIVNTHTYTHGITFLLLFFFFFFSPLIFHYLWLLNSYIIFRLFSSKFFFFFYSCSIYSYYHLKSINVLLFCLSCIKEITQGIFLFFY